MFVSWGIGAARDRYPTYLDVEETTAVYPTEALAQRLVATVESVVTHSLKMMEK
jgi:hypothetical protein